MMVDRAGMDGAAVAMTVIGFGATLASMVMPIKYPNAPMWAINLAWWGGLIFVAAGICYLIIRWARTRSLLQPFDRTVSLSEGARLLYEEMRGTPVGSLLEGHSGAPSVLDNAANHILQHMPITTKRPPSTRRESLSQEETRRMVSMDEATAVAPAGWGQPVYAEPRLRKKDLARLIQRYRKDSGR